MSRSRSTNSSASCSFSRVSRPITRWAMLSVTAFCSLIAATASADEPLDRTIWRRVEVAPGISQDYEVRFEYRLPFVAQS